jgi:ABC transporter substrate binding protein
MSSSHQRAATVTRHAITLVAWYRCYSPRAGGTYDSHHWTAGIAGRTRRGGGWLAARRARAAGGDAGPLRETVSTDLQAAARKLGLQFHVIHASAVREFDAVFATLAQLRTGGLVIGSDPFFNSQSEQLAALAIRHSLPAIYQYREFAVAGGLMSYGGSLTEMYRQVGVYTGRILKGERPADLPVVQATKVELIVNLRTAKALGLEEDWGR